ncbi:ATP-binding protein [Paenibacillus sp.]|uniref:ATP-binding protein n=1 Tax=Paenibacillus sp. TaxID=58172 RepID=UPI0028B19CC1|nr:ATP-binding protein [Paenibacillus sp.]
MRPNEFQSFDFAFTHAVIGMALVSFDGTFLKWNSALCTLLGYDHNELLAPSPSVQTLLDQIHEIAELGESLSSMNINPHRFQQDYYQPTGHLLSLEVSVSIISDGNGAPLYYFTQFENKTMIRQMETQLQDAENSLLEKENSFLQLLEGLPLTVVITANGIVQYANSAGLQLIHAESLDQVLGISTTNIVDLSNYAILQERRERYFSGNTIGSVCYLINCLNGQQKYVDGFTLPITFNGNGAFIGIFKDISQQMLEDERLIQSEKLSTAGQLAAGIAHEIRNPLTAINGFMKLIRSSERMNDKYFFIIESELKRIEFIVNELLVLSKPQTTHVSKPVDLLSLLEQVTTLMNGQAALKNLKILPVCADQSIWINGEAYQLKQVFINLLKNAMEAMNSGGNIYIHVLTNESETRISVQDEGCGMTEEQIKALGKPFYTTKETGTGLGFMITQNIVHNHGGWITVESIPEQGTTFTVIIPTILEPEETVM